MSKEREALKLALEALEEAWYHVGTFQPTEKAIDLYDEARTAIKETLAQPEQNQFNPDWDAMAVMVEEQQRMAKRIEELEAQTEQEPKCGAIIEVFGKDWRLEYMSLPVGKHKLYTQQYTYTPPQRTWVGLTDEDKVLIKHDANFNQFMTAGEYADRVQQLTEARLKDKNT